MPAWSSKIADTYSSFPAQSFQSLLISFGICTSSFTMPSLVWPLLTHLSPQTAGGCSKNTSVLPPRHCLLASSSRDLSGCFPLLFCWLISDVSLLATLRSLPRLLQNWVTHKYVHLYVSNKFFKKIKTDSHVKRVLPGPCPQPCLLHSLHWTGLTCIPL